MLNDWEKYILKLNRIPEEEVSDLSCDMLVTFKDGTQKRICEIFSRCMGYLARTVDFNVGKRSEFDERKMFTEVTALKRMEEDDNGPDAA